MPSDAGIELKFNTQAKQQVKDAAFLGVREVFELDIKPEAQRLSPVRAVKGPKNPRGIPGGTNKRSIDTQVNVGSQGQAVVAQIFSQSGYGGYLETGTSKMKARPYIYPAFNKFKKKLALAIGEKIRNIKGKLGVRH